MQFTAVISVYFGASCKTPKTPFDKLRVNGILIDPFVVSLSDNLSRSW